MYIVYWMEVNGSNEDIAHYEKFWSDEMTQALKFMETLRAKRRAGEQISHVVMAAENPNSVGQAGVAEVGPDYSWTKRRHNERKHVGTDSIECPVDE